MREKKPVMRQSVVLSPEDYESVKKIAAIEGVSASELIRKYIFQGMNVDKTKQDIDFIRKQIREELKVISKANTERIIKIIIKAAMIEISTFFYVKAVLKLTDPALEEELWEQSRKETAAYLGMRNSRAAEQAYRDFVENFSLDYDDTGENDED